MEAWDFEECFTEFARTFYVSVQGTPNYTHGIRIRSSTSEVSFEGIFQRIAIEQSDVRREDRRHGTAKLYIRYSTYDSLGIKQEDIVRDPKTGRFWIVRDINAEYENEGDFVMLLLVLRKERNDEY